MLEEAKQKLYSEAGVSNLVAGIICIFVALLGMAFVYGIYFGNIVSLGGAQAVLADPQRFISLMALFSLAILFLGILGGFEIGRYVQTEFTKRRIAKTPPPPPT